MRKIIAAVLVLSLLFVVFGCSSKTHTGAVIGGASGAAIGAAVGGAAGAYIGNVMDKQAAEIEADIEGATVERIGEGIKITFDSGILFDIDKAALRPEATTNLDKLAVILNKYEDTDILIEGHTDATGPEDYNLDLSERRGKSVANQLATDKVNPVRFTIMGYGEVQPVATHDTSDGRQQNRRVEIAIMANEKLKKAAEEKTG